MIMGKLRVKSMFCRKDHQQISKQLWYAASGGLGYSRECQQGGGHEASDPPPVLTPPHHCLCTSDGCDNTQQFLQ